MMTHLTGEQFEDILRGAAPPAHVDECRACSARLAEMRAIQGRLRKAFGSATPEPDFAERLRRRVRLSVQQPDQAQAPAAEPSRPSTLRPKPERRPRRLRLRTWWTASVAALVMIAVGLLVFLSEPEHAMAGRAQLVEIYENSLCLCGCVENDEDTCQESDPEKLAAFMQTRFGFVPLFPKLNEGLVLRGGCAGQFREQAVAAYVVLKGDQPITVVAIPDPPETLRLSHRFEHLGTEFWSCAAKGCNLAAVRLGEYTYCAVGKADRDTLTAILADLLGQFNS